MISLVLGLFFVIVITAAIALGTSFILRVMKPESSAKKRTAIAATCSGIVPMALPMVALLVGVGF